MTETLAPCLDQFRELMKNIALSLDGFKDVLEELHALGEYHEEVVVETDAAGVRTSSKKSVMPKLDELEKRSASKLSAQPPPEPGTLVHEYAEEQADQEEELASSSWMDLWKFYRRWESEGEELLPSEEDGAPMRHRRVLSAILFKKGHYHTVTHRSPRIQAACADISNQYSILLGDVEEVPFDRDKYAAAWME